MATVKQTEFSAIEYATADGTGAIVTESSDMAIVELSEEDLDLANGGATRASNTDYSRHRTAMSGKTFAGPDGAGSSFDMKTEDISSSSSDFMTDD
jgi:hypothetical protein